jgi:hypothetical protein
MRKLNKILIFYAGNLLTMTFLFEAVAAQTNSNKPFVPTVTIPAPPGSKGFGMPQTARPANAAFAAATRPVRAKMLDILRTKMVIPGNFKIT